MLSPPQASQKTAQRQATWAKIEQAALSNPLAKSVPIPHPFIPGSSMANAANGPLPTNFTRFALNSQHPVCPQLPLATRCLCRPICVLLLSRATPSAASLCCHTIGIAGTTLALIIVPHSLHLSEVVQALENYKPHGLTAEDDTDE